jgi:hypothetical protein
MPVKTGLDLLKGLRWQRLQVPAIKNWLQFQLETGFKA